MEEVKTKISGFNIAALVLGIVSVVTFCMCFVSIPCAVLALVFSILGIKKKGKGMAIAGLITALVTLTTWFVLTASVTINYLVDEGYDYPCYCYEDFF